MEEQGVLTIPDMLSSIERYNPEHIKIFEDYVKEQARENSYHLEANLAVLKLYQFNPHLFNLEITYTILLKALTNLPHADFTLCKCLLLPHIAKTDSTILELVYWADILEGCDFELFWQRIKTSSGLVAEINGFYDSIRKFVCHVVGTTYQTIERDYLARLLGGIEDHALNNWLKKYGWKSQHELVFIANQENNIKTKNITEKIEFDNLAPLMAACL